jgi:hypothetical protein
MDCREDTARRAHSAAVRVPGLMVATKGGDYIGDKFSSYDSSSRMTDGSHKMEI